MTKYQLKDKKSQESLVDGRDMRWHRLDKQPNDSRPARYTHRPEETKEKEHSWLQIISAIDSCQNFA